jgi:hypothetical protein
MQRLRLLLISLLATACVLPAIAQAPAVSLTPGNLPATITILNPQAPTTSSPPSTLSMTLPQPPPQALSPHPYHFDIPKDSALDLHADTRPLGVQVLTLPNLTLRKQAIMLAQTHSPCYTLRVYGFTPPDLKSAHPHASSETDCTPASSAHLKVLQVPATVNTK